MSVISMLVRRFWSPSEQTRSSHRLNNSPLKEVKIKAKLLLNVPIGNPNLSLKILPAAIDLHLKRKLRVVLTLSKDFVHLAKSDSSKDVLLNVTYHKVGQVNAAEKKNILSLTYMRPDGTHVCVCLKIMSFERNGFFSKKQKGFQVKELIDKWKNAYNARNVPLLPEEFPFMTHAKPVQFRPSLSKFSLSTYNGRSSSDARNPFLSSDESGSFMISDIESDFDVEIKSMNGGSSLCSDNNSDLYFNPYRSITPDNLSYDGSISDTDSYCDSSSYPSSSIHEYVFPDINFPEHAQESDIDADSYSQRSESVEDSIYHYPNEEEAHGYDSVSTTEDSDSIYIEDQDANFEESLSENEPTGLIVPAC